ncbi:gamma-butyrobetaine dioxygenase-like [Lineus longissimus]|uniref:gamma-butyrobetaine dioxygenase-like n=1 Tax=Lineus longissimus TaxID=88925 RepID=UPI00315C9B58
MATQGLLLLRSGGRSVCNLFRQSSRRITTNTLRTLPVASLRTESHAVSGAHGTYGSGIRCQHSQTHETASTGSSDLVQDVAMSNSNSRLCITYADGKTYQLPYVYLRDNCQCPRCWHPSTLSRQVLMMDLDINIKPSHAKVVQDGKGIEIAWPDGHVSPYPSEFLRERSFSQEAQSRRVDTYGVKHQMWGAEHKDKMRKYDFLDIINNDRVFLDWLLEMERCGLTMIQNAPREIGQLEQIGARVCFLRRTNYGDTFVVKSKQDPSNLAYTNKKLGLHCDLPFYNSVPGIQMLHCVRNTSKGGENQFADASFAATQLREKRPDLYKVLTDTLVDFYDMGVDYYKYHKIHRHPIIKLDYEGNVLGIHYNNQVRDSFLNIPLEKVQPLYEGMKMLDEIMYDPKNRVDLTLKEGNIVVFDNIRILHGRNEYQIGKSGERFLEGAYIDWDTVKSRIRVLREELGVKE